MERRQDRKAVTRKGKQQCTQYRGEELQTPRAQSVGEKDQEDRVDEKTRTRTRLRPTMGGRKRAGETL